jgi:hypothetical protein
VVEHAEEENDIEGRYSGGRNIGDIDGEVVYPWNAMFGERTRMLL